MELRTKECPWLSRIQIQPTNTGWTIPGRGRRPRQSESKSPRQHSHIEADPRLFQAVQSIACILESLGYAVFAGMVPLNVVDELLGGTVRVAWRNLHGYVEYERKRTGSRKNWEWFQWLAEQIDRHSKARTR